MDWESMGYEMMPITLKIQNDTWCFGCGKAFTGEEKGIVRVRNGEQFADFHSQKCVGRAFIKGVLYVKEHDDAN
jgi:hypothetical protein